MPPEIGWREGVRDGEADGTREDPGERGLPQAQDAEACDEGGGQPGQVPQHPAGTPGAAEESGHPCTVCGTEGPEWNDAVCPGGIAVSR